MNTSFFFTTFWHEINAYIWDWLVTNVFIGLESNLSVLSLKEDKISSSRPIYSDPIEITKNQSKYFEFVFNPIAFTATFRF